MLQTQVARRVASIHVESTTKQEQTSPRPEPEEETNYLSPLSENRCGPFSNSLLAFLTVSETGTASFYSLSSLQAFSAVCTISDLEELPTSTRNSDPGPPPHPVSPSPSRASSTS